MENKTQINLYKVFPSTYEYCYFVFATSRNKAKSMCVNFNNDDETYCEFRVKTLAKNVKFNLECAVGCEEDKAYSEVKALGFEFTEEEYETDGK